MDRLPDERGCEDRDAAGRGGEQGGQVKDREHQEEAQLPALDHGVAEILGQQGELLSIYNKAREKTLGLEQKKNEKKAMS